MRIIYYDSTGRYLSVIAAAVHLNRLDSIDTIPEWEELEQLAYFDTEDKIKTGEVTFVGTDQLGNDIYILGSNGVGSVIEKAIHGIKRIFNIETRDVFIDLTKYENLLFEFGLMIKEFNYSSLANRLIYSSLADSFSEIKQIVDEIKQVD